MKKCLITILDEVNCKLTGLEPATIRKCVAALKFTVPNARFLPSVRLGRWDGKVSYFSVGGNTQINLLSYVIPLIEQDNYAIDIDDLRISHNISFNPIDENVISNNKWPSNHPTRPDQPIILMPHQVEVVNACLKNLQGVQIVPTSAGKTILSATLCKQVEHLGKTILIVPNKQLVKQTHEDFLLLGIDVGVYFGDQKDLRKQHTICTWQSLEMLQKKSKLENCDYTIDDMVDDVVAVIVDEAHNSSAACLTNLLTRAFRNVPIRWGLTGTLPKEEHLKIAISACIGNVINKITASDLQAIGVLSNCEIQIMQLESSATFRTYQEETAFLTSDKTRLNVLAKFVNVISEDGNTLVLVQNIKTGKYLESIIKDSIFISGAVKVDDRKEEYDKIATENNKIIIATFGVASTGINIPRIYNLVFLEAGKSFVKVIQSIGRSLRRASDKDFAIIYDFCSTTKYSKKHLTERKKFYKEQKFPFSINKIDTNEFS